MEQQLVDLIAEVQVYTWRANPADALTFRCLVGTNTWLMEGDFIRNGRQTWWLSGTNLVESTVFAKGILAGSSSDLASPAEAARLPDRSSRVHESADGNPGKPVRQSDLLTLLQARLCWLAFCSGPCLRTPGRRVFPPGEVWKESIPAPAGFADHVTAFEDALGLPNGLDLFTETKQLVFQYRVTASTTLSGWHVPLEFYAAQYQPIPSPDAKEFPTGRWELSFTAKGKVVQIRGSKGYDPTSDGPVSDARLAVEPCAYA